MHLISMAASTSTFPSSKQRQASLAGQGTFPLGELAVLEVAGVQLQPQQEVVELGHKGPIGEDLAESIGEP